MLDNILRQVDASRDKAVTRLFDFLRIPSVSTNPNNRPDVARCAEWLATQLRGVDLQAQVYQTALHPVVVARNVHRPGRRTVLVYGHYDVQPAEPLEQWTTPPFGPAVREGAIYARGAADDKGQVWAHVEAIRAWQQGGGERTDGGGLPVNLILLFEGEEEIGSPSLGAFLEAHKQELKADVAVVSDTSQFARGLPAITYGLRGLVYEEILLSGPGYDLHSGVFGGAVANPGNVLCELIASLHNADGRVNVPGFYDDVVPLEPRERELWAKLPFSESDLMRDLGVSALAGEKGYTALERKWARPTCDVNGITTGFQGEGAKTIIPAKASAKVSMRLVPNQNPQKIREAFEKAIRERCPAGVNVEFLNHSLADAMLVPLGSKAMGLAAEALRIGFGKEPTFMREGGSIPVVALIRKILGIDSLLVGFGLPDDRAHSPNEKFDLGAFHGGTRTCAALYAKLAGL